MRWRATVPNKGYETLALGEIRRRASLLGLRLVATPHRQDHVFVAFAEDTRGLLHHLAFDAHDGTLLENETTGVMLKSGPGHPGSGSFPLPPHRPLPSQATKAPPNPDKGATVPAPTTVTAKELPPIAKPVSTPPAPATPEKKEDQKPDAK